MNHRTYGNEGEQAACDFLTKRGWTILDRNVRRGRGEIDIIARRRGVIAFIEVKRRSALGFGTPAEAVNHDKQRRILSAASIYLQENEKDAKIFLEGIRAAGGSAILVSVEFDEI